MAKILNLDKLIGEKRTLTLNGVDYTFGPMTVKNFMETTRAAAAMGPDASYETQVEQTVAMLVRSVPRLTAAALEDLELPVLNAMVEFVKGDSDGDTAATPAEGDEAGK